MTFMVHLGLFTIGYNTSTDPALKQYFLTGCLAASFARDRLEQFFKKCFAFVLITVTAWTVKKQRRRSAMVFLILNFVLFIPVGLTLIGVASLLSAPLLPLFTFPLFLIGFPRTKRFWPDKANFFSTQSLNSYAHPYETHTCPTKTHLNADTAFYTQLVPHLLPSLKQLINTGSLGGAIQPDTFYLSRFQDRIMWIQIMESGSSYQIINIKGLELQETSCHTREAQSIDDAFDRAFENPAGAESNNGGCQMGLKLNPNVFSCMESLDVLVFDAYSDAKNSLVGVLDSPENINLMSHFFPKILHYFLIKHAFLNKKENLVAEVPEDTKVEEPTADLTNQQGYYFPESSSFLSKSNSRIPKKNSNRIIPIVSREHVETTMHEVAETKNVDYDHWSDNDSLNESFDAKMRNKISLSSKVPEKMRNCEAADPFDFDLNDILGAMEVDNKKNSLERLGFKNEDLEQDFLETKSANSALSSERSNSPEPKLGTPKTQHSVLNWSITRNKSAAPVKTNKSKESDSLLRLPRRWTEFLNENLNTNQSQMNENKSLRSLLMSKNWIRSVFGLVTSLSDKVGQDSVRLLNDYDVNLSGSYCIFILKCCITLGLHETDLTAKMNASAIHKFYEGGLPWSPTNEKLTREFTELHQILIKSFQYRI